MSTVTPRSADSLPVDERIMMSYISRLETGRWKRKYAIAAVTPGDAGGLSVGWLQLARRTRTNLLVKACEIYLAQDNADPRYKAQLESYMPHIRDHSDKTPETNIEYRHFFVELAEDSVWRACQDEIGIRELDRARELAKKWGWENSLSLMTCYEGIILGGIETCMKYCRRAVERSKDASERKRVLDAASKGESLSKEDWRLWEVVNAFMDEGEDTLADTPIDPSDETDLLKAYIATRHSWLKNFRQPGHPIRKAVYRTESLMWLWEQGMDEFELDMEIKVFSRVTTITEEVISGKN